MFKFNEANIYMLLYDKANTELPGFILSERFITTHLLDLGLVRLLFFGRFGLVLFTKVR